MNEDYIRIYLGLVGSGKTTQALQDVEKTPRVIIYSPTTTNPGLARYPLLYDTPDYLRDFERHLSQRPRIRFEKRSTPTQLYKSLARVRGAAILLDDVATLKTHPEEKQDFEALLRLVRINGNRIILTTHRANDVPPVIRYLSTSIYYVGPGHLGKKEMDILFDLVNYQISFDAFYDGLKNNPARVNGRPAGIFTVRKSS